MAMEMLQETLRHIILERAALPSEMHRLQQELDAENGKNGALQVPELTGLPAYRMDVSQERHEIGD